MHRQALGKVLTLGCLECTEGARKGSSLGWAMSTGRRFPVQTAPCETREQGFGQGQERGTNFFFDPLLNSMTKNNPYRHAGRWLIWHPFYATLPNLEPGCFVSCTAETKAPVCTSSDFLQAILVDFNLCMSIFLFGIANIIVDAWHNYWGCKSCSHWPHLGL